MTIHRHKEDLSFYFSKIKDFPLLDTEEEKELARKIKEGDNNALEKMICSNLRFVFKIVFEYRKSWINFSDLIQAGNIGLMKAAKKFVPDKGARFATYAKYYIKNEMNMFCVKNKNKMHVPIRAFHEAKKALSDIKKGICHEFKKNKYSIKNIQEAEEIVHSQNISLDASAFEADGACDDKHKDLYAKLEENNCDKRNPQSILECDETFSIINELINSILDEREKTAIEHYYGLHNEKPETLEDVGKSFGISSEMARLIINEALQKIRYEINRENGKWF